jgi:2-(1,2-epoxy-1,2-dihydrophenyl)acetyl-CoA isomerase
MSETATQEAELLIEQEGGVLRLTLNRPKSLNALTHGMLLALTKALKKAAKDDVVRVVVLAASGRAFCAGADLTDLKKNYEAGRAPSLGGELRQYFNPLIRQMRALEKPIVCAVNGLAAGAGASLALAADIKICTAAVKFISAFSQVGLVPDSGFTHMLTRTMGVGLALEHAWTAKPIPARQAEQFGLVNRVVPSEDLEKEVGKLVQTLTLQAPRALALTKRAMNHALDTTFDKTLEYEAHLQEILGQTEDHLEGVNAFLEGRPARFTGK